MYGSWNAEIVSGHSKVEQLVPYAYDWVASFGSGGVTYWGTRLLEGFKQGRVGLVGTGDSANVQYLKEYKRSMAQTGRGLLSQHRTSHSPKE